MKVWRVLWLTVLVTSLVAAEVVQAEVVQAEVGQAEAGVDLVGRVVRQVMEQHLAHCHVVLLEETQHNSVLPKIVRDVASGVVVVEAQRVMGETEAAKDQLLQGLWGDPARNCRALLVFLDHSAHHAANNTPVFRFLEWCGLWQRPDVRVVVVGTGTHDRAVLLHHSLRNTLHALYLALLQRHKTPRSSSPSARLRNGSSRGAGDQVCAGAGDQVCAGVGDQVWVYRRCLYCEEGDAGVQLLQQADATAVPRRWREDGFFNDPVLDMNGHKSRIAIRPYFPFIDFEVPSDPSKPVSPLDSLDVRMLNAIAAHLNFTYEMREPLDKQWGIPGSGGNWTGVMGELQQQRADHTTMLMLTPGRSRVVQFSKLYTNDPIVLVSLKPQPLPRHLSIIRPFPDSVWQLLLASMVGWSVALWVMLKVGSTLLGGRSFKLSYSFNFGWAILMGNPQDHIPSSLMARILVGCWLIVSLVLSSAYRSALMANLAVQEYSRPINSFQDLVKRPGFTWGSIVEVRLSAFREFFTENGPLMRRIYDKMEIREFYQGLARVLKGRHAFIIWKNLVKPVIARQYTDSRGQNPFALSTTEYPYLLGYSWGFRRGAPFRLRFATLQQRLIESGLVNYWLEDVLARNMTKSNTQTSQYQEGSGGDQVVLGLDHLQGAFYILLLGSCFALVVLLAEHLTHLIHTRRQTLQDDLDGFKTSWT
ncbi:glutamate receptor ionotropic, kainate glr-3 isoform X2 [Procambarus clarkii]|uniref:glutamate receptor ionotropic, kainate glr-3 isoform X2 n=1 Tax=Procambarus clarkii TaxID=6728 RepID=UPI00374298C9